jgi:hypothetical protein
MRPHKLVFHGFLGERELFNEFSFKGDENVVNEGRVPSCCGLINNKITNHSGSVIGFRSQNVISILLRQPVVLPNVNFVSHAYFPAAALIKGPYSLMDTPPSVARIMARV